MKISVKDLAKMIDGGIAPIVIDVREAHELEISSLSQAIHIPMNDLNEKIGQYSVDDHLVIMCRTGSRSNYVTQALSNAGYKNVKNLTGGINEWAKKIDKSITIY